jgi:uncharacterized protein
LLASDLHGSNVCFTKLVALAVELRVSVLAVAGDWSGKRSIFLVKRSDGSAVCLGARQTELSAEDLNAKLIEWRNSGVYPIFIDSDTNNLETDFASVIAKARSKRLTQWLDYGQAQTRSLNMKFVSIPGNDDGPEIENVLATHPWVSDVDQRIERFGEHEFFGLGYSNPTPWHTPRELSEAEIEARLSIIADKIERWPRAIGVIHVPPFDSGLDLAPELTVSQDGVPRMTGWGDIPVGSHAVRAFVEKHHPLAVLSGHCHGARGLVQIGSTTCANAGSQYHAGVLCACFMQFDDGGLYEHQFFCH